MVGGSSHPVQVQFLAQQKAFFVPIAFGLVGAFGRLVTSVFVVQDKKNAEKIILEKNNNYEMKEVYENAAVDIEDIKVP